MTFRMTTILLCVLCFLGACSTTASEPPASEIEAAAGKLLQAKEYRKALQAFSKIAYDGPGSHRALVGMAICYAHLRDRDRFEAFALEAAAQSPLVVSSYYRLGVMYVLAAERFRRDLGGFRYAQIGIEYLRRVFAAQADFHTDLIPTLGLGLHLAGDHKGALIMLEEGLRQQPGRVDVIHTMLLAYRELENKERVKELLSPYKEREELPDSWARLWAWADAKKSVLTPRSP